jgi:hypothetical protein
VVFNLFMRRAMLPALLLGALVLPASASAEIIEIGGLGDDVRGTCPQDCQAVSRTTGYQAKVGPDRTLYRAPRDGRIVAWRIGLGNPGPTQREFFDNGFGGASQAAVVVLDPLSGRGARHRVVAKAPLKRLAPFFGRTVRFPLARTLPVKRGQIIALTVPTWAPALQVGQGSDTSWRAPRADGSCSDLSTQAAMVGRRRIASFGCLYKTARLTYSATLISTP